MHIQPPPLPLKRQASALGCRRIVCAQSVLRFIWAFAWLPVESLVHQHQARYHQALRDSTRATDCAPFIFFMLECIRDAVAKMVKTLQKTPQKTTDAAILSLLRKQPDLSFQQIAAKLGKSNSAIKRAVRGLREAGRLRRIGSDKGGYWEVAGE